MLALIWIKSDSSRWKEFAANCVADIQSHCRGDNNPADLLTRGLTTGHVDASEEERTHMLLVASAVNDKMLFYVEQWSINRFISNVKLSCKAVKQSDGPVDQSGESVKQSGGSADKSGGSVDQSGEFVKQSGGSVDQSDGSVWQNGEQARL